MVPILSEYQDNVRIADALDLFFDTHGLGPDGGIDDNWIKIKLGTIAIPFPNFSGRRQAILYHDIHHMIAGYPTTWIGEAGIGAWEIASGCGDYSAAWVFNMGIFSVGMFVSPTIIFSGFIRGKRAMNFYHHTHTYDQIRSLTIGQARSILRLDQDLSPARTNEKISFISWWLVSFITSAMIFVFPVWLLIWIIVHWH